MVYVLGRKLHIPTVNVYQVNKSVGTRSIARTGTLSISLRILSGDWSSSSLDPWFPGFLESYGECTVRVMYCLNYVIE